MPILLRFQWLRGKNLEINLQNYCYVIFKDSQYKYKLQDELIWGAAWLYKVTKLEYYWKYVNDNIPNFEKSISQDYLVGGFLEFGWDAKHAGIAVLFSQVLLPVNYS